MQNNLSAMTIPDVLFNFKKIMVHDCLRSYTDVLSFSPVQKQERWKHNVEDHDLKARGNLTSLCGE
jgi:hypothetical protein